MLINIPSELKALNQWVVCDMSLNEKSEPKKFPLNPRTGQFADITNPSTWGSFEEAVKTGNPAIGFVFTVNDEYAVIDLDDKLSNPASAEDKERFTKIVNAFNSYTEISTSGRGVHIIVKGSVPKGINRNHVEVYSAGRYMIFTGNVIRNVPIENQQKLLDVMYAEMQPVETSVLVQVDGVMSDAEIIERASNASNSEKYKALCNGDLKGYPSQSEADFALLAIIAFYTKDNEQVRRLFRMTALGKRDKATRNDKYIDRTLSIIRAKEVPLLDLTILKQSMRANTAKPTLSASTSYYSAAGSTSPLVNIICADSVTPEAISWLWNGYLARGKFHVFAGTAGTGKTTLALNLAATISKGGKFADGTGCAAASVLIWSGEDDARDTLIPRLIASGANLSNIHIISDVTHNNEARSFDPAIDMSSLLIAVGSKNLTNIGLVIVDPVVNAVAGDSHKNGEVRRALAPLLDFGQRTNCAILGISHFSKGTDGRNPLERVTGSLAFGALARIVLATAKISEGETSKRIFCRAKSNIGLDGDGFEYDIQQTELKDHVGIFSSYAIFGKAVEGTALELLAEQDSENGSNDCVDFLSELLGDSGKMAVNDIFTLGVNSGFSKDQLKRAKKQLKVKTIREGFGKGSVLFWAKPVINLLNPT